MSGREWRQHGISLVFRAPLPFVYAWCTDYTPEDGKYGGEDRTIHLRRKIVERTANRVVFENVFDEGDGWGWERHTVTLRPPDRWHCEGHGNYSESVLDYRLTALAGDRTGFGMRWRSRPTALARGPRASVASIEKALKRLWRRRARALEREYAESQRPDARPTRAPTRRSARRMP